MSTQNRSSRSITISEGDDHRRVVRTDENSSVTRTRAISGTSNRSLNERGQIVNRHQRRVTLAPSQNDAGAFGWGSTLISSDNEEDPDQNLSDDNNQWQETSHKRSVTSDENISSRIDNQHESIALNFQNASWSFGHGESRAEQETRETRTTTTHNHIDKYSSQGAVDIHPFHTPSSGEDNTDQSDILNMDTSNWLSTEGLSDLTFPSIGATQKDGVVQTGNATGNDKSKETSPSRGHGSNTTAQAGGVGDAGAGRPPPPPPPPPPPLDNNSSRGGSSNNEADAHRSGQQHAVFVDTEENEKRPRQSALRFREPSLSTVGSFFKEKRHSADRRLSVIQTLQDDAFEFLQRYKTERALQLSTQQSYTRRLRWRIDIHLMILLFLCCAVTFLDKLLLNYARVMGMLVQLNFDDDDYANASSYFYVASIVFSLPNIWLLNRIPAGKCLAIYLIGWGLCTACHAALRNYGGLVALLVLSGAFEAGFLPALMLLISQYFTYQEQALRFAYWQCGRAFGQMLGGLLSFAFQHMSTSDSLSGWKTMFLLFGLITIILGVSALLFIPDSPMKAEFLTNEEKVTLLEHIKVNQTGITNEYFYSNQMWEGLFDVGCWILYIIALLHLVSAGVTAFYSATLLTAFGYTPKTAALLTIPSGVISFVCALLYGIFVRYLGRRWMVVCFAGVVSTVGAALLYGLTVSENNKSGLLAGLYLINFLPGATLILMQWMACNVAGHTKRVYAAAAMNAIQALGGVIGLQAFRGQAEPEYRSAKLTVLISMVITVVLAPVAGGYYWMMNKERNKVAVHVEGEDVEVSTAYAGLTDKQNKAFRYHL